MFIFIKNLIQINSYHYTNNAEKQPDKIDHLATETQPEEKKDNIHD